MPDERPPGPEPRLDVGRRALLLAGGAVLALGAVFAVAVWVFGASGGTPTSTPDGSASVVIPPSSTAPAPPRRSRHPLLRAPLQPITLHRDPSCPIHVPVLLRVMQFNIRAGLSRYGGLGIARIAAEIEAAHPDLVSLNEVDDGTRRSGGVDEPAYLAHATGLHAVFGANLGYDGGLYGNAILSRYPIVASHNTRLPGARGAEPRGLLEATLRIGRRRVDFYSVHLTQGQQTGGGERERQAEAVARIVHATRQPTILSGDLNSWPTELPVLILRQYLLDAQQYGGRGAGLTVPEGHPEHRIDYILYDNHFAPLPGSTQVLPSASSDHRSVWTELVLRPQHQC